MKEDEVMSIHDSKKDVNKGEKSLISREEVDLLLEETGFSKFGEIQSLVSTRIGMCIGYGERKVISDSLRAAFCTAAEAERAATDNGHRGILIFTAYTDDYSIGKLCDTVNRRYADKNGYKYVSKVLPYESMMHEIGPYKLHCTWYKVLLLNMFLREEADMLEREGIQVRSDHNSRMLLPLNLL